MHAHVDQERHVMFQQSADEAQRRLMEMIEEVIMTMSDRMDEVFVAMRRDYRSVLGGGDTQGEMLPKSQRLLRKQVIATLDGVEKLFKTALGQAADDDCKAEGEAKNLEECGENQDLDADDVADRQLKSEQGERKDVLMRDIPGSASWTDDNPVPNNQVLTNDNPQVSSNHSPASTDQENGMIESIHKHSGDGVHLSVFGQPKPQENEASNSDQEDFNSADSHKGDQEDLPTETEQDDEMDSFDSFPPSDY